MGFSYNNNDYFYTRNNFGDIIENKDKNGNIKVSYEYDAWGNIISKTDNFGLGLADKNPFRYRGYRYETETNLYYLNSRYYNPQIGRFINANDLQVLLMTQEEVLGSNLFTYGLNNPVMNVEPSGYLSLGKNWCNSVTFIAPLIDILLIMIPAIAQFLINIAVYKKAQKAAKIIGQKTVKAIENRGKNALKKMVVDLSIALAKNASPTLDKIFLDYGTKIVNAIFIAACITVGSIITEILDRADGVNDGYIFA